MCVCVLSHFSAQLCVTPWTPPGSSVHGILQSRILEWKKKKKEYWSGLPCPPPGDLPHPGIEPASLCLLHWQAGFLPLGQPGKPMYICIHVCIYTHMYIYKYTHVYTHTHTHIYLNHFAIYQKLTQHCKSAIFQLKKRTKYGSFSELVMDREAWHAAVHGVAKELDMTEWLNWTELMAPSVPVRAGMFPEGAKGGWVLKIC